MFLVGSFDGSGAVAGCIRVHIVNVTQQDTLYINGNSPTKLIVEDPIVLTGINPTQDTVIPFFAVLDRVDVNVVFKSVLSTAISVTV